jgi:2-C-methyl-D-erythritol 4-phosphate cytidylyltransferase
MQLYAIIVAGGTGSRMQSAVPKQLLSIHNKPVIYHTVSAFAKANAAIKIIVVCHATIQQEIQQALTSLTNINITYCQGGNSRYESVQQGLAQITETQGLVLIHDAVRCLVTPQLIQHITQEAIQHGNAIPVINVKDSMRIINGENNTAIDRNLLKIVQTPQAFLLTTIQPVFKQAVQPHFTDEATVCEQAGIAIHLVQGEETNIKITYPADLQFAQHILNP